jgi:DEAD/DEAH box helicase domain-containing protein
MTSYLVYDCEIARMIPSSREPIDFTLEYCGGWNDYAGMGISVIGYLFVEDNQPYPGIVSYASEPKKLKSQIDNFLSKVVRAQSIIGFNSRNFDDRLLQTHGIPIQTDYDLLENIRLATIGSPRWQDTPSGWSYKLDAIARVNGMRKTGSGELAPKLWQQGRKQELVDYCLNDVAITHKILNLGIKGELIDPNTRRRIRLPDLSAKPVIR